jgi:hypothetical protein
MQWGTIQGIFCLSPFGEPSLRNQNCQLRTTLNSAHTKCALHQLAAGITGYVLMQFLKQLCAEPFILWKMFSSKCSEHV